MGGKVPEPSVAEPPCLYYDQGSDSLEPGRHLVRRPHMPVLNPTFLRVQTPLPVNVPVSSSDTASIEPLREVPALQSATVQFTYRAGGRVHLPSPPANVWRGQLGYYLRRLGSESAHENDFSLYQRLFRTPASAVGLPEYGGRVLGPIGLAGEHVPHPFVVRLASSESPGTDLRLQPGETATVELVLMGATVAHLPQLTAAFEMMGTGGLGSRTEQPGGSVERGPMDLKGASLSLGGVHLDLFDGAQWSLPPTCGPELYDQAGALAPNAQEESSSPPGDPLLVRFQAPTRLKHSGEIVRPSALTSDALAACLYRRAVGMAVCYGEDVPEAGRIKAIGKAFRPLASATTLGKSALSWTQDSRYSHRQERRHPAGGLTGTLRIEAPPEHRSTWRRWLRRAEQIHLGKATSMGLGSVEIV